MPRRSVPVGRRDYQRVGTIGSGVDPDLQRRELDLTVNLVAHVEACRRRSLDDGLELDRKCELEGRTGGGFVEADASDRAHHARLQ